MQAMKEELHWQLVGLRINVMVNSQQSDGKKDVKRYQYLVTNRDKENQRKYHQCFVVEKCNLFIVKLFSVVIW